MTPAALIMLVLTVVIVWGGLVATTVALRTLRTPDAAEAPAAKAPAAAAPSASDS
ncbi:methionine/alanine import family NSS transporter small subunit [Canibacter oris]|uniref:Methionine/alanine import family NSS transporter small subunit n=1 Tax=Canibacter oris TaxID=1365628 RepID=A0A840DEB6_9MICO|nr:methionine/alanine import family NSS transporter small subunit [Canibacter oris]MBB4071404.1 hypothetical protein [Canibacter oris]